VSRNDVRRLGAAELAWRVLWREWLLAPLPDESEDNTNAVRLAGELSADGADAEGGRDDEHPTAPS
jgi:hypothetical protein